MYIIHAIVKLGNVLLKCYDLILLKKSIYKNYGEQQRQYKYAQCFQRQCFYIEFTELNGRLSLKIKNLHIHLYFIASTYEIMLLWNTQTTELNPIAQLSYTEIDSKNICLTGQSQKIISTCIQFESRKTNVVLLVFLSNSTQIPSKETFIIIYVC